MTKYTNFKPWLWVAVFAVLLILSLDYWAWSNPIVLSWGAFPNWLYYFIGLQMVFILAIYSFTRFFWK